MVRFNSMQCIFIVCLILNCAFALDEKNSSENVEEKTVKKRGILNLGIHGHHHIPHVHLPKIPTVIAKPIFPTAVLPPPPHYHITPGDAVTTSINVNYPRYPVITKTYVPSPSPVLPLIPHHHHHHHAFIPPYHHHHSFVPHFHNSFIPHHHHHAAAFPHYHEPLPKPIIPVAVPFPGIRQPKYPVFFNPKPIFVNPQKPQYIPIATPNPTFVPIPIPENPHHHHHPTNPTFTGTSSNNNNHNNNCIHPTQQPHVQTSQEHHHHHMSTTTTNPQGNWQPIIMFQKPTQTSLTEKYPPYNYHAALTSSSPSNISPMNSSNNFISGQGGMSSQLAQQLALYQHHQQQQQQLYQHENQNSFPYPAETFSQNYETASNDGNYHGLTSYQVPIHK